MPIAWLALFLGISAAWLYGAEMEKAASSNRLLSLALADNMLLWHQAAIAWRQSHPEFSGAIPASGLVLPNWYVAMAPWHSQCDSLGAVSTYATSADGIKTGSLAAALSRATSSGLNAGLIEGGLVTPSFRPALIAAPIGIPNGAALIVTQVVP